MIRLSVLCLAVLFMQCTTSETVEKEPPIPPVISLLGRELLPPESSDGFQREDSLFQVAKQQYNSNPDDLNNIIWLGRRTAYLWRYNEAIDIFTKGLEVHPQSPELYRHRGHRFITVRQFDKAIADYEKAAELAKDRSLEIEPDGIPNKLNQPLSNLHFNIYYHLGLAHYLKGDFAKAAIAYEECLKWSLNADLHVATADWLYMSYRRMGQKEKAEALIADIPDNLELIENDGYYERIMMYKGLKQPENLLNFGDAKLSDQVTIVTQGYGVGNWYGYNDQQDKATEVYKRILKQKHWSAFGYIAAEAELARNDQ